MKLLRIASTLLIGLLTALSGSGQTTAQLVLYSPTQIIFPFPIVGNVTITATGVGFDANTRLVLNGTELQTVKVNFNTLQGIWTANLGTTQGNYKLWAWESTNHSIASDPVYLILGSGARNHECQGGLVPQSAPAAEIILYEAKWDTLNCYYLQPPKCFTDEAASAKECTP